MSEESGTQEQRAGERLSPKGSVLAYQKKGCLGGLLKGKSSKRLVPVRNMSSTGVCFLCHDRLRAGQKLTMTIRLSDQGPNVVVEAQVVRKEKGRGVYEHMVSARFVDFKGTAWQYLSHLKDYVVLRDETSTSRTVGLKRLLKTNREPPAPSDDA